MLVLQETTPWPFPLHIYFTDNSKRYMYAYINGITGEGKIFKSPIGFSAKGRTFEKLREFHL
jgi:hypothetical protein